MIEHPSRIVLAALALLACSESARVTGNGHTPVSVTVAPPTAEVELGGAVTFTATVTGAADGRVTWSVVEAGGGSVDGAGRYTAPAVAGVYHVRAESVADPAASASAAVTVTDPGQAVRVTVSPPTAAIDACRTVTLTATVAGSANQAVTWSVLEGAAGGAVSQAGVYTAPAAAGVYHVVAASVADPARSASAAITVSERVLSVRVDPAAATVPALGAVQLTATVTTTCGSFPSAALRSPEGPATSR